MEKMALIFSNFANKADAVTALQTLMQQQLATTGNVAAPHLAVYPWKGEIHEVQEVSVLFKTPHEKKDALMKTLREIHPYELPCIMDLGANTSSEYTTWLNTPFGHLLEQ